MKDFAKDIERVYCQGIEGAYSHIAAKSLFPQTKPAFLRSFEDVCRSVKTDEKGAGVLPFENSTAGIVNGIVHLLLKYDLTIAHAKEIKIRHMLCAKKGTRLEDVEKIFSHQQALIQCSDYLSRINSDQIETPNTAVSAKMALEQKNSAAICSKEAAKIYGLEIIGSDICNSDNNMTRFIVIRKDFEANPAADVTSVYFKVKNESGALFHTLKVFADHGINLISLHSLPLEDEPWHYGFYVDTEGSLSDIRLSTGLDEAKKETHFFKILGSYKSERG